MVKQGRGESGKRNANGRGGDRMEKKTELKNVVVMFWEQKNKM